MPLTAFKVVFRSRNQKPLGQRGRLITLRSRRVLSTTSQYNQNERVNPRNCMARVQFLRGVRLLRGVLLRVVKRFLNEF
jgi:hypothetical protein